MTSPKEIARDIQSKLGEFLSSAIGPGGSVGEENRKKILDANVALRRSIKTYEKALSRVLRMKPETKEDIIKEIAYRRKVPPNYIDKRYKQHFWKVLDRVLPWSRAKNRSQAVVKATSRGSIIIFKSLFSMTTSAVSSLLDAYPSSTDEEEGPEPKSDYEDDDLEKKVHGIEKDIGMHDSKQSKEASTERYSSYISEHKSSLSASADLLEKYKKVIAGILRYASPETFSVIYRSSRLANTLALALAETAVDAKKESDPVVFVACTAIYRMLQVSGSIVQESVPLNRKQRKELKKEFEMIEENTNLLEMEEENTNLLEKAGK